MNQAILIGGAPGVGKSFLARRISENLKLPWISTDTIREMMRKIVVKEQFPELLHFGPEINAENYLSTHTARQIVDSQNKESFDVWKGVKAIIETDYVWKTFVIEGIAVLPEFVSKIDFSKALIKPIFLIDEDKNRIKEMVYKRGVWDDANKYSDKVKGVEVEWVTLFNEWLKKSAEEFNFDTTLIESPETTQKKIISDLEQWMNHC